jgi:small conductance mechanosensitive channel
MENYQEIIDFLQQNIALFGLRIISALVILIIGRWLTKFLSNWLYSFMSEKNIDLTLAKFFQKILYFTLLIATILASLTQLGIETTSFMAILGAAGLAVGLALQGSLSNFAAGILIIVLRPFNVGDSVEIAGASGTVDEISILTTKLITPQNQLVVIPNSRITSSNIINYTARGTRRMDLKIGISYDDDIKKAKQILNELVESDPRILKSPKPTIALAEFGDSSINLICRPWTLNADFWNTQYDLLEKIKERFDQEGISFPYPSRDVYLHQTSDNAS